MTTFLEATIDLMLLLAAVIAVGLAITLITAFVGTAVGDWISNRPIPKKAPNHRKP